MKICIVEDELILAQSLKKGLNNLGFNADYFLDGLKAERQLELHSKDYDAVILDLMLPNKSGIEICKNLRTQNINFPILILSARGALEDKIVLLNAGADDYLIKPFSFEELIARLRALLRRPEQYLSGELKSRGLLLNLNTRKAFYHANEIELTSKEFALLEYFMRHPNQAINREQIIGNIWDFNGDFFSNVVDVLVKNLRKKIEQNSDEKFIETVRGFGYRFKK